MARPPPSPLFTLRCSNEVTTLIFVKTSDGGKEKLLTGHNNGELHLWDLDINRQKLVWNAHNNQKINWIGCSNNRILSYGRDNYIYSWTLSRDTSNAEKTDYFPVECCTHCPCALSPGEPTLIAVPHDSDTVRVFSLCNWQIRASLKPLPDDHRGMLMYTKLIDLDKILILLTAYENGTCVIWNTENSKPLSSLTLHKEPIMCLDFHNESRMGISGSVDTALQIWKITSEFTLQMWKTIHITNPGVNCVQIHPSGSYVASGGWDNRIRIFSWKTLRPLAVLDFHLQPISFLSFSQQTGILAVSSRDGRVSLWNLYNKKRD